MDITPKQTIALLRELKMVRECLEGLHNSLNEGMRTQNAAEIRYEQDRQVQPVWLDSILAKYHQPENDRKTESRQQYSAQNSARWAAWCTFVATVLAFVAAAVYAWYAKGQLDQMRTATQNSTATLTQLQNQTTLMRQQLVGTLSAIVDFDEAVIKKDYSSFTLSISNRGHITTAVVEVRCEIQHTTIDGSKQVSKSRSCSFVIPQLEPAPYVFTRTFKLDSEASQYLETQSDTFTIKGDIRYDNGVGDKFTKPFCVSYVGSYRTFDARGGLVAGGPQFFDCEWFKENTLYIKARPYQ